MKNEIEYALENSRAEIGITPSEISLPLIKVKEETGKPANLISIGEVVPGTENFSKLTGFTLLFPSYQRSRQRVMILRL